MKSAFMPSSVIEAQQAGRTGGRTVVTVGKKIRALLDHQIRQDAKRFATITSPELPASPARETEITDLTPDLQLTTSKTSATMQADIGMPVGATVLNHLSQKANFQTDIEGNCYTSLVVNALYNEVTSALARSEIERHAGQAMLTPSNSLSARQTTLLH